MSTDDPIAPEALIAAAIDAAGDIRDPLEGLVEKTTTDPGAPFVPGVLESFVALKTEDRAAFEVLRAELKKAGCRGGRRLARRRSGTRAPSGRHTAAILTRLWRA